MRNRSIPAALGLCAAITTACAPSYDPPEQALVLGQNHAVARETLVVSAFFVQGALAEIKDAECTIRGRGVNARFKTPARLSVPVPPKGDDLYKIVCKTPIGSAIRESSAVLAPLKEDERTRKEKDRTYPMLVNVRFK